MFQKPQKWIEDRRLVPDQRWCSDRRIADVPIKGGRHHACRRLGDRRSRGVRRKSEI
jgi:hypothetical protein